MKNNTFDIMKKYNKEFQNILRNAEDLHKCNKSKCKKQFDEFQKYSTIIMEKLRNVNLEETALIKKLNLQGDKVKNDYINNNDVKKFFEYKKKKSPYDKNIEVNFKKQFKIYKKNIKKNLKLYQKTEEVKKFNKELKNILSELETNIHAIEFKKCSFKECLEVHKKGIYIVKDFANKLCKENMKKSCKIHKFIDKLDLTKLTFNDNKKLLILIKKGIY